MLCDYGEDAGGACPAYGREGTMATMIADCSCDYHASGWPFPWEVTESWVDDSTLERLCEFESCQVYLAAQKDLCGRG